MPITDQKTRKKTESPESKIPFQPDPKCRGFVYTIRPAQMQSIFSPARNVMPCRVGVLGSVAAANVYIVDPSKDETPIFLNVGDDPDAMARVGMGDPFFLDLIRAFAETAVALETKYPCRIPEDENTVCLLVRNEDVYGQDQEWDGCGFDCSIGMASYKEFAKRFQKAFPAGAKAPLIGFSQGSTQTRH
ncbi:MAG: hypothetical protein PHX24_10815 [Acidithiobacillus sp.]|nr:hypothetical protein [Acidithiobacillus sp.]